MEFKKCIDGIYRPIDSVEEMAYVIIDGGIYEKRFDGPLGRLLDIVGMNDGELKRFDLSKTAGKYTPFHYMCKTLADIIPKFYTERVVRVVN